MNQAIYTEQLKEVAKRIDKVAELIAELETTVKDIQIGTYLTEFIKRFPEYQDKEQEVIDALCRKKIFGLENCHRIGGAVISPVECKICWNRPYKEDETK